MYTEYIIKKLFPEKVHTLKSDNSSVIVAAEYENLVKNPHAGVVQFDIEVNMESFSLIISDQIKISTTQHKQLSCTCIT